MSYQRTVSELLQKATVFWPADLSKEAFEQSVISLLLETQDLFVAMLNVPVNDINGLFDVINVSAFSPHLFLKHLLVLTDFGGEMLQRVNEQFHVLFPMRTMEYRWGDEKKTYVFKALPVQGTLSNTYLQIGGRDLSSKVTMSDLMKDVCALLILGGICTDERAAAVLNKCTAGQYLGDPNRLANHIKQRYIWVSRIINGAYVNKLGQLAEQTIVKHLQDRLGIRGATVKPGGTLPGVSHHDEKSRSQTATHFDIVVSKGDKCVGIEVSFQVTTNSVIERKGREARAIFEQVEKAGHRIAYILDGAGNFQRRTALENLCTYSHCTIAFSPEEFDVLCAFLREFFQE